MSAAHLLYGTSAAALMAGMGAPVEPAEEQVVQTYRGRVSSNSTSSGFSNVYTVGAPAPNKYIVILTAHATGIAGGETGANISALNVNGSPASIIRNPYYANGNHLRRWRCYIHPHQTGSDTTVTIEAVASGFILGAQVVVYTIENADPTPYDFYSAGGTPYNSIGVTDVRNPDKACILGMVHARNSTSSEGRFATFSGSLPTAGTSLNLTLTNDTPVTNISAVGSLTIHSMWEGPSTYSAYYVSNTTIAAFVFGPPRDKKFFFRPGTSYYVPRPSGVDSVNLFGVGGGGGGGSRSGGGGGGAGSYGIKLDHAVVGMQSYTISVGDGGTGGGDTAALGGDTGGDTSFDGNVLGKGGGGGGSALASSSNPQNVGGYNGGSGGGTGRYPESLKPGSPILGQGTRGGYNSTLAAGAGGGATGIGGSAVAGVSAGAGGSGINLSSIFGTGWGATGWFCGGGGGGIESSSGNTSGAGGSGGGGAGGGVANSTSAGAGQPGVPTSGGGGGGGSGSGTAGGFFAGGKGGSGILLVDETPYTDPSSYRYAILRPGTTEFNVPSGVTEIDVFLLAGGGGAASKAAGNFFPPGAGGAGGVVIDLGRSVTPEETISVSVGTGGAVNNPGTNTTFDDLTAVGGGRGGSGAVGTPTMNGGSGGGGNSTSFGNTPGSGTAGQGNAGGISSASSNGNKAGGGGGFSTAGSGGANGDGGDGYSFLSTVFFEALKFGLPGMCAGGGGGGVYVNVTTVTAGGYGGLGGGGRAGQSSSNNANMVNGSPAAPNTGSGGGGCPASNQTTGNATTGGAGSDGFIVIRYLAPGGGVDPDPDPDPEPIEEGFVLVSKLDELDEPAKVLASGEAYSGDDAILKSTGEA